MRDLPSVCSFLGPVLQRSAVLSLAAVTVFAAAAVGTAQRAAAQQADLGGEWVLNEALSDDLQERLWRWIVDHADSGEVARDGGNVGPERLAIALVDEGVRITVSSGRSRLVRTDRVWRQGSTGGEIQSFWKKAKLVTRTRGRGQGLTIQEYRLNRKGQLVVVTTLAMGFGDAPSVVFKRVYDRGEGV